MKNTILWHEHILPWLRTTGGDVFFGDFYDLCQLNF